MIIISGKINLRCAGALRTLTSEWNSHDLHRWSPSGAAKIMWGCALLWTSICSPELSHRVTRFRPTGPARKIHYHIWVCNLSCSRQRYMWTRRPFLATHSASLSWLFHIFPHHNMIDPIWKEHFDDWFRKQWISYDLKSFCFQTHSVSRQFIIIFSSLRQTFSD